MTLGEYEAELCQAEADVARGFGPEDTTRINGTARVEMLATLAAHRERRIRSAAWAPHARAQALDLAQRWRAVYESLPRGDWS